MSKITDLYNNISLGRALDEVNGYIPFDVSDEQKAAMATEIYKTHLLTLGLREVAEAIRENDVAEAIRENAPERNVWNEKNLVSFIFEVLQGFHYSGVQIKKSDNY